MKSTFNRLWLIIGIIWLAAVFLTCWNGRRIDDLATQRERNEQLRKEMLFQHRNSSRLAQVKGVHSSYYLPVASAPLGFEGVRSRLHGMADHFGLKSLRIEFQTAQATEGQLQPILLRQAVAVQPPCQQALPGG